ncbi:iron-siderophore ABC transporter substrate-binding protein [Coleofasciculus sp.]|uniref:iron-siderophore ABC transporter substrate-binding protein n=1 Tax=Coleofasciculus sp. TaxID=3100458 RepID=UPI003A464442
MHRKSQITIRIKRIYQQLFLFGLLAVLVVACNQSSVSETSTSTNCPMVDHVAGETCVPLNPERVVVLGVPTLANALALGIKPVGSILYFDKTSSPSYLEGKLDGIELVGTGNQPNLEKILILEPDLIIAMNDSGLSYDQMSQIAPTVVDNWYGYSDWKEHFNFVAEVLGKTEESKQVWAHYEQRIQELRAALGDHYQDTEVSFVRVCCGRLATDVKNSFSGMILDDVGLSRPSAQDVEVKGGLVFLSEELITDMDGDIIFVVVDEGDDDAQKMFEQLQQKPLWNKLKAVQQGRVYTVNLQTWRGGNPLAAYAVIDDLFKYLVDNEQK